MVSRCKLKLQKRSLCHVFLFQIQLFPSKIFTTAEDFLYLSRVYYLLNPDYARTKERNLLPLWGQESTKCQWRCQRLVQENLPISGQAVLANSGANGWKTTSINFFFLQWMTLLPRVEPFYGKSDNRYLSLNVILTNFAPMLRLFDN